MTIRRLFPLLFVAMAAVALVPERASAQCWSCGVCRFDSNEEDPEACTGRIQGSPLGFMNCHSEAPCRCELNVYDYGDCLDRADAAATTAETVQLQATLAAIRARKSIPADGPFVYLKQGTDFVVRRKCDRAEMGRVAIAEVHSALIVVGG